MSSKGKLTEDDHFEAKDFAKNKAKTTFHRVLVEETLPTSMTREKAFALLEEHVTNNLLKVGPCGPFLRLDGQTIFSAESWDSTRFCSIEPSVQYILR
jgi:hypothetical protein